MSWRSDVKNYARRNRGRRKPNGASGNWREGPDPDLGPSLAIACSKGAGYEAAGRALRCPREVLADCAAASA
jgi:hypothetical protein